MQQYPEVTWIGERRLKQEKCTGRFDKRKRRHIADKVIVFGNGDRHTNNSTGISVHFDTGTGVLSCWDGSAWLEVTLS